MDVNSDSLNSSYDDLVNELERGELTFDMYNKYKDLSDKDFLSFFLNKRKEILSTSSEDESISENTFFKSNEKHIFEYTNDTGDQHECFNWELGDNNYEFYNQPEIEHENCIIMKSTPKSKKRIFKKNDEQYNKNNIYNQNNSNLNEKTNQTIVKTISKNTNDFINISIN